MVRSAPGVAELGGESPTPILPGTAELGGITFRYSGPRPVTTAQMSLWLAEQFLPPAGRAVFRSWPWREGRRREAGRLLPVTLPGSGLGSLSLQFGFGTGWWMTLAGCEFVCDVIFTQTCQLAHQMGRWAWVFLLHSRALRTQAMKSELLRRAKIRALLWRACSATASRAVFSHSSICRLCRFNEPQHRGLLPASMGLPAW